MTLTNFKARELLVPIFRLGKRVYKLPSLKEIQKYSKREMDTLWAEYKRLTKPHVYKVDLSDELYNLKNRLLKEYSTDIKLNRPLLSLYTLKPMY